MPRRRSATPTLPVADFLVIGSGVAGLRAAIGLSRAGRSRHRILRAGGDATGTEMVRVLLDEARSLPQIAWRDHHFTIDLLLDAQRRCVGALVLDESSGAVKQVKAKAVVLATGGAGQIYARTTNPPVATGDGIAMAYRAGAIVEDMEFVQFHPTALYLPATPQFLLTE